MKKVIILLCIIGCAIGIQAQSQHGLKGSCDLTFYPNISFVWNSANPEIMDESAFQLKSEGNEVYCSVEPLEKSWYYTSPKNILILWEDMASHYGQFAFSSSVIYTFLAQDCNSYDYFNVAVFNRKHNNQPLLQPLYYEFTNDNYSLMGAVANYRSSTETYPTFTQMSDLYQAINDGVEMLKEQGNDRDRVIIVFTAGLNMKAAGATTEMGPVAEKCVRENVQVYVVKFPCHGDAPEIDEFAKSTYGLSCSTIDAREAVNSLWSFYNQFDDRCYGRDYEISYYTDGVKDGAQHSLTLTVDRKYDVVVTYTAPERTFMEKLLDNIVWVIVGALLLIGIIIWIIIASKKSKKKIAKAHQDAMIAQQSAESTRREQEAYKQQIEIEKRGKALQEENERLLNLMNVKNVYPRLQCTCNGNSFVYNVNDVTTRIGRNSDNDVVLDNSSVSRHHAQIVFTGNGFDIVDLGSTNKVIVNGTFQSRTSLKNGDIIGLGEAVITFYL